MNELRSESLKEATDRFANPRYSLENMNGSSIRAFLGPNPEGGSCLGYTRAINCQFDVGSAIILMTFDDRTSDRAHFAALDPFYDGQYPSIGKSDLLPGASEHGNYTTRRFGQLRLYDRFLPEPDVPFAAYGKYQKETLFTDPQNFPEDSCRDALVFRVADSSDLLLAHAKSPNVNDLVYAAIERVVADGGLLIPNGIDISLMAA